MKKRIIQYLLALILCPLGAASCHYLDVDPELGLSDEEIFSTYKNFWNYFSYTYDSDGGQNKQSIHNVFPFYYDLFQYYRLSWQSTTDASDCGALSVTQLNFKQCNLNQDIIEKLTFDKSRPDNKPICAACFGMIRKCNVTIEHIDECKNITEEQYNAPHPNPANSYGATYGAHREALEFDAEQHAQLKKWCEEAGIIYSTSVWDLTSAKEITGLHPRFIKIPSACNTHYEMLQWLCDNYEGEIQLSFGMTTREEEEEIVRLFEARMAVCEEVAALKAQTDRKVYDKEREEQNIAGVDRVEVLARVERGDHVIAGAVADAELLADAVGRLAGLDDMRGDGDRAGGGLGLAEPRSRGARSARRRRAGGHCGHRSDLRALRADLQHCLGTEQRLRGGGHPVLRRP